MVSTVDWAEAHRRERERKLDIIRGLEARGVRYMPLSAVRVILQADRPTPEELLEIEMALAEQLATE